MPQSRQLFWFVGALRSSKRIHALRQVVIDLVKMARIPGRFELYNFNEGIRVRKQVKLGVRVFGFRSGLGLGGRARVRVQVQVRDWMDLSSLNGFFTLNA